MSAYYNEFEPGAAATLEVLISEGLIAPGVVDKRSIKDVRADDLRGYDQCHFFAGIGIWSGALRAAGWEDDRPIGSASCPCQGFSLAGKGLGFDDPRHLWPDYLWVVDEAREQGQPWAFTLIGEQVASAGEWLDLVQSDLETRSYAFAASDLPAAGFEQGAHIRQRFYWVADRHHAERWADLAGGNIGNWAPTGRIQGYGEPGASGAAGGMGSTNGDRSLSRRQNAGQMRGVSEAQRQSEFGPLVPGGAGADDRLGHHHSGPQVGSRNPDEQGAIRLEGTAAGASGSLLGCDWLFCHDGKIRPVESGAFPLAATSPGRLGALRIYGNGLDLETAVNFISAYMEACEIAAVMSEFT